MRAANGVRIVVPDADVGAAGADLRADRGGDAARQPPMVAAVTSTITPVRPVDAAQSRTTS